MRLLAALHQMVLVKFDIDGVIKILLAIIGVKQGDLLGPGLFTFFHAAVMETWRATSDYPLTTFRTRPDFVMSGRPHDTAGEELCIGDSEYADDTALPFETRHDVEEQTPALMVHFARWGMEIHAGVLDPTVVGPISAKMIKDSKSEIMFCPKPLHMYADRETYDGVDVSPILLPGDGFMLVVDEFCYLGDIIAADGSDDRAVDARIASGGKAFGALRGCIFSSSSVSPQAKRAVYEGLVLANTLYGSECWALTETLRQRLRVFQGQCVRAMCRVTRKHTWDHHISTSELEQRLGLDTIEMYVARRQLRWLGHVSRMDFDCRLPRKMLSAWVPHKRPRGAPKMTYERSIAIGNWQGS